MKKNIVWFNYFRLLNNNFTNKNLVFGIAFIILVTSFGTAFPKEPSSLVTKSGYERAITWDVSLHFNEPGSAYDYTIFGEAPDANDGPPADAYDTVKPPAPMPSYIRAWFNDNLTFPYNTLWKDYRHYPDDTKTWNLTVQWVPVDGESSTTITMSWSPAEINTSEYNIITLCTNAGTPLKNMILFNSYFFSCPAYIPQTFKIICLSNEQPNPPSDPSPANGSIAISVNTNLEWNCSDPDGDPLTYDVYFGTTNPPPKVASNVTSPTYDPGTMNPGTMYYWKIIAWDNHNMCRVGSLWHFTTLPNQPPYPPSNPYPPNGGSNINTTVIISWIGGDPDPDDIMTYDIYFGTASPPPKVISNLSGATSYEFSSLDYETVYYWKIVAWDNHGASTTGPLWHFTTEEQPNQPPNPPSNPIPANGSTNISVDTDFDWTCSDPDGDLLTYDVYFGTTNPPPKVASNISSSYYDPGHLWYYTYYYWRIIAWDDQNASTAGSLWCFRTINKINRPPYAPCNPCPSNGSTEVPLDVELCWTGGDPDYGDFITYDVYFGVSFPLLKVKSNISSCCHTVGNLSYSTKHYWQIIAWDNQQATNASPVWSFTTKKDVTVPSLAITSPQNGFIQVNLWDVIVWKFPIFITTILIGQIEVSATATDSQSGMNRVEIWIDEELKTTLTTPPYTWTWVERGYGFQYLLTVKAYDNAGNVNPLSMRVWKIF